MKHANAERPLSVIGAPSSAGAYGPGQERAPMTFRQYGLLDALQAAGVEVVDRGDGSRADWKSDGASPGAANVHLVAAVARELADTVATAFADSENVLVLGGDCTIELGTVAGAVRDGSTVGLAYVDLDADLNTPATGDGILDWMGVAHLLAVPGAHAELCSLASQRPMLDTDAVRLLATANITAPEQNVIDDLNIHVELLAAVAEELEQVAARTRDWAKAYDRLLVHVDIDVLDFEKFPIAENTDLRGGLDLAALGRLLTELCTLPNWRALTLTEVNPGHAPDERHSFEHLISMLTGALGTQTPTAPPVAGD